MLFVEIDPEDTPRLLGVIRTKLLYFLDVDGGLGVKTKLSRVVIKRDIFDLIGLNGPVEFLS